MFWKTNKTWRNFCNLFDHKTLKFKIKLKFHFLCSNRRSSFTAQLINSIEISSSAGRLTANCLPWDVLRVLLRVEKLPTQIQIGLKLIAVENKTLRLNFNSCKFELFDKKRKVLINWTLKAFFVFSDFGVLKE